MSRFLGLGFIVAVALLTARWAMAEQPICTGDRHYDGVACCPYVEDTTTTTTIPLGPNTDCPEVQCPAVTCDCQSGPTTVVNVSECPPFPNYVPCRKKKDGTLKCPRPATPRRVLVPQS